MQKSLRTVATLACVALCHCGDRARLVGLPIRKSGRKWCAVSSDGRNNTTKQQVDTPTDIRKGNSRWSKPCSVQCLLASWPNSDLCRDAIGAALLTAVSNFGDRLGTICEGTMGHRTGAGLMLWNCSECLITRLQNRLQCGLDTPLCNNGGQPALLKEQGKLSVSNVWVLNWCSWCQRGCIYYWMYSNYVREAVFTFEEVQMMSERLHSILNGFRWCRRGCSLFNRFRWCQRERIQFLMYSDYVRENVFPFE